MTDVTDHLPPPTAAPGWLGQATEVEKSRAVAEVQGAIIVAQRVPRRLDTARTMMAESCRMPRLAERAFFSYSRGDGQVTGPTVHLARELARCWGNIQYGIAELRRDDEAGLSEITAFGWDVQTNVRASTTFIVPHKRDKRGGPVQLKELRDIYENNANMGSRRLREQIFAVLPKWFTEEGEDICRATLAKGDGTSVDDRRAGAIRTFAGIGVTADQLERKLARPAEKWTVYDLAQLMITHRSLLAQELTVEDAFPQVRVTADEIRQQATTAPLSPPAALDVGADGYDPDDPERPM
jgi:hypothetical protein